MNMNMIRIALGNGCIDAIREKLLSNAGLKFLKFNFQNKQKS